jgi:cytochrome c oxidase subunit 1
MATVDATRTGLVGAAPPAEDNYLTHTRGFLSWALTLDHKRIGVMYLVGVSAALALGGVFAMLVRTELLTPGRTIMSHEQYNVAFTLHGAIMVFLFIIPGIPAALGNFVLPIMLGTKDVAFPKLNLTSFYLWLGGAAFFLAALYSTGLDTGWTFYTPYSVRLSVSESGAVGGYDAGFTAVVAAVTGVFILGFSSIFTGLNFLVTIHTMRAPGMSWFHMPLFVWAVYATGVIQLLATPVLAITLLLLIVENVTGFGFFNPRLGGDPVLFQHFFWFYSHPAVYIMILPAMGVISELIAVYSRKHIFGYRFIAYSSVAIALLGFLVWGHHMFTSGQSTVAGVVFSAITFTIAIPSAVKVFNWLATMYKGSISFATPMLYALSFMFLFTIGGLTGLFLATLNVDVHLHDSYFVVAHFHYVMVGGSLTAFFGGLFHWWPKITGKMYNELGGQISALLVFLGFNFTFFPQFVMGTRGSPRRYYNYLPTFQPWHEWSTYGAYILATGGLVALVTLLYSLARGPKAPANPWGGASLDWECSSPPPHDNFSKPPAVHDCYDFSRLRWNEKTGGYDLK